MSQETMMFAIADVKALAEHVIADSHARDSSGNRTHDGLRYCTGCRAYDYEDGSGIEHKTNCVTKIAQDVLTGLTASGRQKGSE